MPVAVVTGGSRGLGLTLVRSLAADGWSVVTDARDAARLRAATAGLPGVTALPGDVADPAHRRALVGAAARGGRIDVVVNNASALGPSPLPSLAEYPLDALTEIYAANVVAPLGIAQLALPHLAPGGRIINITSDAAVEAYEGWGGYGSSKAALDQLTAVLAAERPDLRIYAVDPGDLRTEMHRAAFPGEDISDRPLPDVAVPGLRRLMDGDLPSGRYRAQEVARSEVPA
jgi:NAD(P)-dependent dehydrogenase (short-subunit alcohol dehydrogenase family)